MRKLNVKQPACVLSAVLDLPLWLPSQGALAPLFASAALFGGYLLVKFFPNLSIEAFLNAYFWLIGSIAVAGAAGAPLRRAVRRPRLTTECRVRLRRVADAWSRQLSDQLAAVTGCARVTFSAATTLGLICMQGGWLGQQPGQLTLPSWLQKEDGTPIGTVRVLR